MVEVMVAQPTGVIAQIAHRRGHRMGRTGAVSRDKIGNRGALKRIAVVEKQAGRLCLFRFALQLPDCRCEFCQTAALVRLIAHVVERSHLHVQITGRQNTQADFRKGQGVGYISLLTEYEIN